MIALDQKPRFLPRAAFSAINDFLNDSREVCRIAQTANHLGLVGRILLANGKRKGALLLQLA